MEKSKFMEIVLRETQSTLTKEQQFNLALDDFIGSMNNLCSAIIDSYYSTYNCHKLTESQALKIDEEYIDYCILEAKKDIERLFLFVEGPDDLTEREKERITKRKETLQEKKIELLNFFSTLLMEDISKDSFYYAMLLEKSKEFDKLYNEFLNKCEQASI